MISLPNRYHWMPFAIHIVHASLELRGSLASQRECERVAYGFVCHCMGSVYRDFSCE